ncbi:MAG TPA: lipase family protein [Negativicutes bacterium]|nr:lipase family protein [Negativicutes bacterium]
MKRGMVVFLVVWLLCLMPVAEAGPKEDYEEAYKIFIAAGASVAAYHTRMGELANRYLEQDGWSIDHYVQPDGRSGARFLVASKNIDADNKIYVMAIVGTETNQDRKLDLQVDKVYFAGRTVEEFIENAANDEVPDTEPKVHQGFNKFIQAGPSAVLRNKEKAPLLMSEVLQNGKKGKLYLTGHSLGGAAATLAGARLLDMGVAPEQIEVITFGAPAVGNAAFAEKFNNSLKLTRVVVAGDPVVTVLQGLVGGYQQLGKEVKFKLHPMLDDPHYVAGYLDAVMKNYYDKRRIAMNNGVAELPPMLDGKRTITEKIYIAPLQNKLPVALADEFVYMNEALQNEYHSSFPNNIQGTEAESGKWLQTASSSGCRWLIVPEVGTIRVRQEKPVYYITVHQSVYDVNTGTVVDMAEFSTGTYNLTPLEAFAHAFKGLDARRDLWIKTSPAVKKE